MDKAFSKSILRANNITVPDDVLIPPGTPEEFYINDVERLGFPKNKVVVKPNDGGSSVGVSFASNREELARAVDKAAEGGGSVLVEQFIPGHFV